MKVLGKINIENVTKEDRLVYFSIKNPVYDLKSCSCTFGYNCDEEIPIQARIVCYKSVSATPLSLTVTLAKQIEP